MFSTENKNLSFIMLKWICFFFFWYVFVIVNELLRKVWIKAFDFWWRIQMLKIFCKFTFYLIESSKRMDKMHKFTQEIIKKKHIHFKWFSISVSTCYSSFIVIHGKSYKIDNKKRFKRKKKYKWIHFKQRPHRFSNILTNCGIE